MTGSRKKDLRTGLTLTAGFAAWTYLVTHVDVRTAGINGTSVGFASFNIRFHQMTGVHMTLYT
ncbi:MAG: phosphoesterase PA-phosphatase, partial [Lachnospiraceae bacterium]|nr:phosphoesterase PA-phosphatase [Candidatus Hippenecus merdae]